MEWLNENLCEIDENVRVELGPQIIELDCTEANLQDTITHPQYKNGARDAHGKIIGSAEKMHCVDWRSKIVPKLWKIYQIQEVTEINSNGDEETVEKYIKVDELEDKDEAISAATALAGGLN